jgi:hypothetical protein
MAGLVEFIFGIQFTITLKQAIANRLDNMIIHTGVIFLKKLSKTT